MSAGDTGPVAGHIGPGLYQAPPRLQPFMPLLRRVPARLATSLLAALAVGEGIVHPSRLRRALAWASAQGARGPARWRLALEVLANHGRFVAQEAMIGVPHLSALGRNVIIEGREHLDRLSSGALLIGFHLGPPRTGLVLRSCGYPVHIAGRLEMARDNPRWEAALEAQEAVRLPTGTPRGRAEGLHRLRNLLRGGGLVYIAADGLGREACRIEVPGGRVVVRMGWLTLRRSTRVPTLPVLTYMQGHRRVIVVHAPLPDPDQDIVRDTTRCQSALSTLVEDYVRRFPSQCRYVVIPPRPRA